jgi:hypothetical protein
VDGGAFVIHRYYQGCSRYGSSRFPAVIYKIFYLRQGYDISGKKDQAADFINKNFTFQFPIEFSSVEAADNETAQIIHLSRIRPSVFESKDHYNDIKTIFPVGDVYGVENVGYVGFHVYGDKFQTEQQAFEYKMENRAEYYGFSRSKYYIFNKSYYGFNKFYQAGP